MILTTDLTLVGHVGVDSGQILVVDPCYVLDDDFDPDGEPTGGNYDAVCRVTLANPSHGNALGGFATGTLNGDGCYPVFAETNERGAIVRLVIDFDPNTGDDEDDYIFSEDDDEDDDQ